MKNDPAFPHSKEWDSANTYRKLSDGGLTKREYFAAMAMQGLSLREYNISNSTNDISAFMSIARASINMADALIEELEK